MIRVSCFAALVLGVAPTAAGQQPTDSPPGWPSPLPALAVQQAPPPDVVVLQPAGEIDGQLDTLRGVPTAAPGQQHWVSLNLALGQPSVARVGVKVLPRENGSLWLEAYGGSVLLDGMYGFGARLQYTAWASPRGSRVMVAPGLGVQILPDWWYRDGRRRDWDGSYRDGMSTLTYLVADVDVSWLYDFSSHCGFELGLKAGFAGRLGGHVGDDYPRGLMWGRNAYPVLAAYSGLRF